MSRRSVLIVCCIVGFSFALVMILYAMSEEPFSYRQDFTRIHRHNFIKQHTVLDLGSDAHYIAGATDNAIYFGNRQDSLELLVADCELQNIHMVRIRLADSINLRSSSITVDSPYFSIRAGKVPTIYTGTIGEWYATRALDSLPFFVNAVSISRNSFAFQMTGDLDGGNENNIILCKALAGEPDINANPSVLLSETNEYFSSMGMLRYSKHLHKLIYTYFYNNEFLEIDTTLNLTARHNTLDSIILPELRPLQIEKEQYTFASTSAIVNRDVQLHKDLLFISSALMAKNETQEVFERVSVIDVYGLNDGKYKFTFHLPDYKSIRMRYFTVLNNGVIAIHGQYAVLYSFEKLIDINAITWHEDIAGQQRSVIINN